MPLNSGVLFPSFNCFDGILWNTGGIYFQSRMFLMDTNEDFISRIHEGVKLDSSTYFW